MLDIDATDAETAFGSLLDRVENGEEVLITRHGKPVARLVRNEPEARRQEAFAAMQRIRARGAELKLGPFNWEEIKKDRDQGRR